jgi:hypothetical protein
MLHVIRSSIAFSILPLLVICVGSGPTSAGESETESIVNTGVPDASVRDSAGAQPGVSSPSEVSATTAKSFEAPANGSTLHSGAGVNRALDSMAKLFARAVSDENIRRQIHDGVAKRFDGDTNVLFSTLTNASEVRAALATEYSQSQAVQRSHALGAVDRLARGIPRFQVAVPARFADWDPASFTPLVGSMPVGVEDTELKTITAYDAEGRPHLLDAQVAPAQPVIILGVNERTDDSGQLLARESTTESEEPAISGQLASTASRYLVELNTVHLEKDHEPWTKGAAEISYRAKSRGCYGVAHTDYDVTGLDHAGNNRTWWDGDGLNLGRTSCPVILYWWEDDSGSYDFTLSYRGFSLGIHMADGDDLIGGHEHGAAYFRGDTEQWYSGLDDVWYKME